MYFDCNFDVENDFSKIALQAQSSKGMVKALYTWEAVRYDRTAEQKDSRTLCILWNKRKLSRDSEILSVHSKCIL